MITPRIHKHAQLPVRRRCEREARFRFLLSAFWFGQGPRAVREVMLRPAVVLRLTSKPLEKLEIQVAIESTVSIRNVYSPSHGIAIERTEKARG